MPLQWLNFIFSLFILVLMQETKVEAQDKSRYLLGNSGHVGKNANFYTISAGIMVNDIGFMPYARQKRYIQAPVITVDLFLPSPRIVTPVGSPRPYLGLSYAAITNGIHTFHTGLVWDVYFLNRFYVLLGLGGTVVSARKLNAPELYNTPNGYQAVGCRVLFNLGLGAGMDLNDLLSIQLYSDHSSNANLCSHNGAIDTLGIRLAFKF